MIDLMSADLLWPEATATDPEWYKDAVIYEVHVRAFQDSNGDGIGDFPGLTSRLDYLVDLGVTAIWVLPFYPSPLRDDGYDIADYGEVNPSYGTLDDFQAFLREAHKRGLRVITELVINHTSDQHPWFQRARRAPPGSPERDFYVWSDTPDRYRDARIIFKDFEQSNWTWDPVARAYFWHRFYSHQPDLNFENPLVREAVFAVMDFWFDLGVDGMRLDAIPYLFEREGTNCENLPETHAYLKALRAHVDAKYPGRMLLAEANQWPEESVAYFGDGDECHMAFNFPVMPRLYMALRMEDRFPIVDILEQTPPIPPTSQWATFLRNHDELTLEMVTDEERDYMYRVYASDPTARINLGIRRRLAPLMGNHRRRIELMNALLFSLPGTPVLYYGDEIGMGDNIYLGDRNGVRTPMQWNPDRNAGFSQGSPQRLYFPVITEPEYHYETINVETQRNNPYSLYWWTKRLIALRKRYPAFGRGSIEFLSPENPSILAFVRRHRDETILVIANLSRFSQHTTLNLAPFKGMVPVELFGRHDFPTIEDRPYPFMLGPHAFYWFALEDRPGQAAPGAEPAHALQLPVLRVGNWRDPLGNTARLSLEGILPRYLRARRWYGGKARRQKAAQIAQDIPMSFGEETVHVFLVHQEYSEGEADTYVVPLGCASGERAREIEGHHPAMVLARLQTPGSPQPEGIVYDAMADAGFDEALLDALAHRRRFRGSEGEIQAWSAPSLDEVIAATAPEGLRPKVGSAEQSNTSVIFGDRLILKLFRRVSEGINPDVEVGRFLERVGFAHTPPLLGTLDYRPPRGGMTTLGVLQGFVPNEGDAWGYTLRALGQYYERVLSGAPDPASILPSDLDWEELPPIAEDLVGPYLESARLLGERTAQLHRALASDPADPAFAPEPMTQLYNRSLYQAMRSQAARSLKLLRARRDALRAGPGELAERVLDGEAAINRAFWALVELAPTTTRTRVHGDYHLGQVLFTGKDFVIIDFEGEPARPLGERRIKRSPLRDVAGMLRSFDYATHSALRTSVAGGAALQGDLPGLEGWARFWREWVSAVFVRAYRETAGGASFVPPDTRSFAVMLRAYLVEKAVYELSYELNNRPDWAAIPLAGIVSLIQGDTLVG